MSYIIHIPISFVGLLMEGLMFAFTIITAASLLAHPAPPAVDAAKAEQKLWQGTWKVLQMEITTGDRTARLKFRDMDEAEWRVKDDHLDILGLTFPYTAAKLRFDPKSDPKHLSLNLQDGTKPGPRVEATYSREGDGIEIEIVKWPRDLGGETVKLRLTLKRMKE